MSEGEWSLVHVICADNLMFYKTILYLLYSTSSQTEKRPSRYPLYIPPASPPPPIYIPTLYIPPLALYILAIMRSF